MSKTPDIDPADLERLNVTAEDVDRLRHMLGIRSHISRRSWGYRNHYARVALSMRQDGARFDEIAERLGVTKQAAWALVKRAGLTEGEA